MKNNVIFWLDGDLTYFGLAKYLQDNHECSISAIIDIPDRPKNFFEKQKLIHFHKTWFYHDYIDTTKKPDLQYLSQFEEKYKINLWILAYNERLFYNFNYYHQFTRDEVLTILEQECKFYEKALDETKPDFLIIAQTNVHQTHLFHELCKARGIKILMLGTSRFGYRCIISTDADKLDEPIVRPDKSQQETWEDLDNYLEKFNSFKNSTAWKEKFLTSRNKRFKAILNYFLSPNTNLKTHYSYYGRTKLRVFFKQLYYTLIEQYRGYFIDKNFVRKLDEKTPYIYLPLHEEPESSLLISAPFYTNQLEVVTSVVKALPVGYDLYVKEHFVMSSRGWRKLSFYKQIMKLPNVKLIHPSMKPKQILQHASLVITIGGTSGLEAALNKKPSIVFTKMDYGQLPSVHTINRIEELPEAIRMSLKKKVNPTDIIEYTRLIEANSFEFDVIGIGLACNDHFYYGGFYADVEITEEQMNSFLSTFNTEFTQLAMQYIKKINQHKK